MRRKYANWLGLDAQTILKEVLFVREGMRKQRLAVGTPQQHLSGMKSTAFKITLGIWLAASVGFWLFGFSSFGWYLPRPGPWTLFLVYGPWLVLLVLLVADWGRRREVVAAKRAAIFVAALIALSIALYPQRDVVKERYFRAVLSSCQASQGGEIVWEDVPALMAMSGVSVPIASLTVASSIA